MSNPQIPKINIGRNPMEKYQSQNQVKLRKTSEFRKVEELRKTPKLIKTQELRRTPELIKTPDLSEPDSRQQYDFSQLRKRHNKITEHLEEDSEDEFRGDVWNNLDWSSWVPFKFPYPLEIFPSPREYSFSSHAPAPSYQAPAPTYHAPAPIYHPHIQSYKSPSYHPPPQPPAYKAVYEVDFTPIFLSLLPLFLVLGTLLGLALTGITSSGSSSTVYVTNSSSPSVAVDVTSTSTSTATAVSNTTTPTSFFPVFIYPNGTFAIPFIPNLAGLINFGGFIIGRSLSFLGNNIFMTFLNYLTSALSGFTVSYEVEDDEMSDYVNIHEDMGDNANNEDDMYDYVNMVP